MSVQVLTNNAIEFGGDYAEGYLKFSNGILICWGLKVTNDLSFVALGNVYRAQFRENLYFAHAFKYNPRIVCNTANDVDYLFCSVYGIIRDNEKISQVDFIRAVQTTGGIPFHYIAIGTWK